MRFGHIIPVSGLKKTLGLDFTARWDQFGSWWVGKLERLLSVFGPVGLALLALMVVGTMVVARREVITAAKKWNLVWALPVGAALHYLYICLFMSEGDISWYHYAEYLAGYLMVSTLVYAVAVWCRQFRSPTMAYVPACCIAAVAVAMVGMRPVGIFPNPVNVHVFETAIWANGHTSSSSRFGMYDSGVFSFVSDRATLSLNGLAGDREILALTLARDMRSITSRYSLDYVVTGIPDHALKTLDSGDIAYLSPKFRVPRDDSRPVRYAVIRPEVYRKERPWQLNDSSLCHYQFILQEGCPKRQQ